MQGRVVAAPLRRRLLPAGNHSVDVSHLAGGPGVYFYRLQADSFRGTRRMIKLR